MNNEPPLVLLHWCPVCERDDRWSPLPAKHYSDGKRCRGKVQDIRYRPTDERAD